MRVVGYVRVSSDRQVDEGVSLDVQCEKIRLFAELHALDLAEVVTDAGISAKTLERPGLARVLAMLDAGDVGGVVVFKLDRLTRNLGDWTGLIERYFGERAGRSLMSVSESIDTRTAAGRMVLNIMMTVAQWERETISERTRAAVDHKRRRGERLGQLPYGSKLAPDRRTLQAEPVEASTILVVRGWHDAGWSLRRIARELDVLGARPKNGGPTWSPSSVRRILTRQRTTS